jgi:hypothetical protein
MNLYQNLKTVGTLLLVFSMSGCGGSSQESKTPSGEETSAPAGSGARPEQNATTAPATTAFGEKIAQIPGKIEAENFDEGESNVAYSDLEEKNQGDQDYRGSTQVDIEKRDDASGGFGVGWTKKGEWLIYTVSVKETGVYDLEIPVACDKPGGTFHLEFDGKDATGPIEVPDTGGWTTLQTITKEGIELNAGQQTMKIVMDTEGEVGSIGDIDCLIFTLVTE